MGGVFGVTEGLLAHFGAQRVLDTPISENGIVGAALGAAMVGMRPVVEIMFGDFLGCAGDQIINQVAKARYMSGGKARVSMVIRVTTGAPGAAAAQHSQSPEAWFLNVPGLKIAAPATPYDAKGLLKTAIRGEDPVIFFEHKRLYATKGELPDEEVTVPFGVARVARSGDDLTIVAISGMLPLALEAAEVLSTEGISCEVIDPRTLVPLDNSSIIRSVRKTGRVLIAYEGHQRGGVGAELAALIAEEALEYLDAPVKRVAARNVPIPYAPEMERFVLPSTQDIITAARALVLS